MATTFKNFLSNDIANTRTLLHEAIPVTGTIGSGTYSDNNIKEYGHGMFQSVYDYPYLSSSANHIFDLTNGYSSNSSLYNTANSQNSKKNNLYNNMAQVLVGYDQTGSLKRFANSDGTEMKDAVFINFARLLSKDEVKKGSFTMTAMTGGSNHATSPKLGVGAAPNTTMTITDASGATGYRVDSPAGEYGYLFAAAAGTRSELEVGQLYYQAGIAILSGGLVFNGEYGAPDNTDQTASYSILATGSTLNQNADAFRNRLQNISFNNTTELNSTIYFCRVNHNDFNYSSNPTYLSGSKVRVKTRAADSPVTYITTVGLYSADNELLAVAKLSEPLRKAPDTELTLRVRLDY